jgi:hypothetical protein
VTLPQLRKRSRYWCGLLGIHDAVFVRWPRRGEVKDGWAYVYLLADHGTAEICVVKNENPFMEFWLVHELLHVVLNNAHLSSRPESAEERAINQTAHALCTLAGVACPSANYLIEHSK